MKAKAYRRYRREWEVLWKRGCLSAVGLEDHDQKRFDVLDAKVSRFLDFRHERNFRAGGNLRKQIWWFVANDTSYAVKVA